ncbi:MAG: DHH family phosphoesterase [Pirellulales bacterium]|nr:DHH family phosphoesterase [Pirellulales bacterium]
MPIDWTPFTDMVRAGNRFLLTSHMRADCDALGSELAMHQALGSLGKSATIVNGDTMPPHIAFIDPWRRVQTLDLQVSLEEVLNHDTLIILDTSSWVQLGPMAEIVASFAGQRLVIDHHVSESDFGAVVFKDDTAEATGRLVMEAIDALGVDITPDMAAPLFAAIATDTGWFRFSSVRQETFSAAARLVAAGANPLTTFSLLYENNRLARLLLRGRILLAIESFQEGRILLSQATLADFVATGAVPTDTEDVINLLLTVSGSECAVLLVESKSGKTKVSLRSRGNVDVQAIAAQFGGGGHTAAAGVQFPGSLHEAKKAILDALMRSA